jgi:ABC-type glutathione transport system ATPase component
VKFYSSGMLVRLGFACAVHVDPEIVLIDEVLAVGDEGFQARCLDKVRSFQREGRSIVIVTHALDQIRQLCDHAVMLDHGRVHAIGAPDDVVRQMRLTILHHDLEFAREEGSKEVEIVGVELLRDGAPVRDALPSGATLTIDVHVRALDPVEDPVVSFALHDATNAFVFGDDTAAHAVSLGTVHGTARVRFGIGPIPVTGGTYWVTLGVHSRDNARVYHVQDQRYSFQVQQPEGRRDQLSFPVTVEVNAL